jgi:hypothetical protein
MEESFTETFGYLASPATALSISSPHVWVVRMKAVEIPMWSMMIVNPGWRSAMGPMSEFCPLVSSITGRLAFSAAGQNQSAVPLVSQGDP